MESLKPAELKKCLKIHAYYFDDEDSDSDDEKTLDEVYEAFKPPPIQIDPRIHRIIEVGGAPSVAASKYEDKEDNSRKKALDLSGGHKKLSKSQKTRLRRKKKKHHVSVGESTGTGNIWAANREDTVWKYVRLKGDDERQLAFYDLEEDETTYANVLKRSTQGRVLSTKVLK